MVKKAIFTIFILVFTSSYTQALCIYDESTVEQWESKHNAKLVKVVNKTDGLNKISIMTPQSIEGTTVKYVQFIYFNEKHTTDKPALLLNLTGVITKEYLEYNFIVGDEFIDLAVIKVIYDGCNREFKIDLNEL